MRILHISDIHFGIISEKSTHHWSEKGGSRPSPASLATLLHEDVVPPPDAVVISGDLGWSGSAEDYGFVMQFIDALRSRDKWSSCPIVVAPGNHDVDLRPNAGPTEGRQDKFIEFIRKLYGDQNDRVYPLLKDVTATDLDRRHRIVGVQDIQCSDGENALILSANSAADLSAGERDSPALVDLERLDEGLRDRVKLRDGEVPLRVMVVHHHLLPFYELNWTANDDRDVKRDFVDPTTLGNSAKLQTWLARNGFQIVLHGHKHIPHTREDVLVRSGDIPRRLIVIGAGSAGVFERERRSEPLSFNILDAWRLSNERWAMRVTTRRIPNSKPDTPTDYRKPYILEVGAAPREQPQAFWAEGIEDCHRAIAMAVEKDKNYRNFMSTVERVEVESFKAPSTCSIRTGEVHRSFHALHPEHGDGGWAHPDLQRAIDSLRSRFQFQHGLRLFNPPLNVAGLPVADREGYQPIVQALEGLQPNKSRAYVGLYDPAIDVTGERQPPSMTGIQFISDGSRLDAVVTFRKIELSAWWVINIFEVGKLLAWASTLTKLKPGRVTFFAAIAEWKTEPKPTIVPLLDSVALAELTNVVVRTSAQGVSEAQLLAEMLEDKAKFTNEDNLDVTGIVRLVELMDGLAKSQEGALAPELREEVRSASRLMGEALGGMREDLRSAHLRRSRDLLNSAATRIRKAMSLA